MLRTTKLLMAIAVSAIALPVAAQKSEPVSEAAKTGMPTTTAVKKTPEQIAKEKADKERIRAEANKPGPTSEAAKTGLKTAPAPKKTPEQLAKEKADKAKRGATPEDEAKLKKSMPGG